MDPITAAAIAGALVQALVQVGGKLVEKGVVEPALESASEPLKEWVQRGYGHAQEDRDLLQAVRKALAAAGAPADDEDDLQRWLKGVGLDRLAAPQNDALRRQVARALLGFTDPQAEPPADLVQALNWPRSRRRELSTLLAALREKLSHLPDWSAPIEYAGRAAERGILSQVLASLARLDRLYTETPAGEAIRVVLVDEGLPKAEIPAIEEAYRQELVDKFQMHDFRGIMQLRQLRQAIRLPLAEIYQELGLLPLSSEEERREAQEELLAMREGERMAREEQRLRERATDALGRAPRLLILGEPGSGKTMSLRFVTLLLAQGTGVARFGLDHPYIPLLVRLRDYAEALEEAPTCSLCNFLLDHIGQAYESHVHLRVFLRHSLEKGACLVLLDGLDEVGSDPVRGRALRGQVVQQVQHFADHWCTEGRPNRVAVTSRVEGYWDEPLGGFTHVQLSPLRPPDEVEEFLLRWYAAYERSYGVGPDRAEQKARSQVEELLPRLMQWPSTRRLATNPLLLTILALMYENVGRLPHRRVKLYEYCVQTLVESWREAQTGMPSELLAELGEETVIHVMAALAYWLHERRPGGTASFEDWRRKLPEALSEEGFAEEAQDLTRRFLHHARHEAGLISERGVGEFGFFHLTFEEYLAARQMARQPPEERRELLQAHWEDPRWHEVILLAAAQLGIVEGRRDETSDFLSHILQMESQKAENAGRQAVLAGRALVDVGLRKVNPAVQRWVLGALRETMQDLEPGTLHPHDPPQIPVRTRYEAGETLDELGWLPEDLNAWVRCPGCAADGGDLMVMKYPVTNAQFERFIRAGGYGEPDYWGGEEGEGWRWRADPPSYRGEGPVQEPEYWRDPRFGRERRGYPVVGVSWHEAAAFAAWLTDVLRRARQEDSELVEEDHALVVDLLEAGGGEVRLPAEEEWVALAGGIADPARYPWDPPEGPATENETAILARANTSEAGLGGTSPVGMYPLGRSHQPFGLMDLAGNVWEWVLRAGEGSGVRGGSWNLNLVNARCAVRNRTYPLVSLANFGFRLVSPISP